jgi:hypothetical protein
MQDGRNGVHWAFGVGGDMREMGYEYGVKVIGVLGWRIEMALRIGSKLVSIARA